VTAALFVNNVLFYTGIGWFPSILESKGWELGQAGLVVSLVAWLGMNFWFVLCMGYPARAVPVASACQAGGMIIGLGYFGGFVGPWAAGAIRDAAGDFGPALYAMAALTLVSLLTARSFKRPAE
jgi:cyanate permease